MGKHTRVTVPVLVAAALVACSRTDRSGMAMPVTRDPTVLDAAVVRAPDAPDAGPRQPTPSPFAVAVDDAGSLSLVRLLNGALVGVAHGPDRSYVVTLKEDGNVEPIEAFLRGKTTGELIRVGGTWPGELVADYMFEGQWRTVGYQRFSYAITASGVKDLRRADVRFALSEWSQNRQVALTAKWTSGLPIELVQAPLKLTVVRGQPARLPPLPVKALVTSAPDQSLVAYPSGRIFVVGWDGFTSDKPPGPAGKPKAWVLDGDAWSVRDLPVADDDALELVAGKDETQTLVYGSGADKAPFVARWNGTEFVRLPSAPRLTSAAVAQDGTVWAVESTGVRRLFRASFPELRFEPVSLPDVASCKGTPLAAQQVAARDARDVWVLAQCGTASSNVGVLLHTEQARAVRPLPLREELVDAGAR